MASDYEVTVTVAVNEIGGHYDGKPTWLFDHFGSEMTTVVGRCRHIRDSDRQTSLPIERRSACDSLEGDQTWLTGVACLPTSVGIAPLGGM